MIDFDDRVPGIDEDVDPRIEDAKRLIVDDKKELRDTMREREGGVGVTNEI